VTIRFDVEFFSHLELDFLYLIGRQVMLKFRNVFLAFGMFFYSTVYADVQVNIGINVPTYPEMVLVPGYPVYYAPQVDSNYFFYDGLYWVFQDESWYQSSWYNGPWWPVNPEEVPQFILRVPVRYYRMQPTFFFGWSSASAPRWGEHWGHDWEQRRSGWDRWDHDAVNTPAPLPGYQRRYSGNHYPQREQQQQELQNQHYRYQPHDAEVKQHSQVVIEQRGTNQPSKSHNDTIVSPKESGSNQQELHQEQRTESPLRNSKSNEDSRQQDRSPPQNNRQKSNREAEPVQSTSPNQQDSSRNQKSPPPPAVHENIQKSSQPSLQQRRQFAKPNRQEQGQVNGQGGQQKQTVQPQKAKKPRQNSQSDPKQGQGNEMNKRRND
jgi:hypothetical protein